MSKPLSTEDVEALARELAALARSGMPLPEGLRSVASLQPNSKLGRTAAAAAEQMQRGVPLSVALAEAPHPAPPEVIAIFRCAEASGELVTMAEFAAQASRRRMRALDSIETILSYPLLVVGCIGYLYCFMALVVLPRFMRIYEQLNVELPLPTSMLFAPLAHAPWLPIPVGVLSTALIALVTIPAFRGLLLRLHPVIPGLKYVGVTSDMAALMGYVRNLTGRGVAMHDALRAGGAAMNTVCVRQGASAMAYAAEKGLPITSALPGAVPATVGVLLQHGEQNGNVPAALEAIEEWCTDHGTAAERRTIAILEPLLIVFVGLMIASVVIPCYLPFFNIPRIVGGVQ